MLKIKTQIYSEPETTAYAVAELLIKKMAEKSSDEPFFNLAVSGGSTPNILFKMLANEFADKIQWEKLRVFWVDERCVDPTSKESNYGTAYELWLKNVPIPQENIYNVKGDQEPTVEALRYGKLISDLLPEKDGFPVFDLILLGMGDDGHTASIFPDNLPLIHAEEPVATAVHPQSGQIRITLTGEVICHAKHVAFVITGHLKADVLDEIIHEKGDFERYPTYYILSGCDAELYLDYESAEKI